MPVQITCPKCRKPLSVGGSAAARVRCPHCETVLQLRSTIAPPGGGAGAPAAAGAAPAPDPGLPAMIGPYRVRRKLGEGAFGVVYQGHDPKLGRDVAIKVLRTAALGSDKHVQRFLREARVAAGMLHGNIVPVYQLGEHGGGYYIASALIPGRPLSEVIPEKGMDPRRAARLTVQLLEALAYAHERGVLHRDVKPSNAMLVEEGGKDTLYLMDFGLAGLLHQDDARMTQDKTVMGTPAYMPPEQARGAIQEVGPASDQYSAGVVLYELLTGRLPFEGGSTPAVIYNVIHTPPTPPSRRRPGLDPRLEGICLRALVKDPAGRFAGCRPFADALRGWLEARRPPPLPAAPPPLPAPVPPRQRPASPAPRKAPAAAPGRAKAPSGAPTAGLPAARPAAPKRRGFRIAVMAAALAALVLTLAGALGFIAWRSWGGRSPVPATDQLGERYGGIEIHNGEVKGVVLGFSPDAQRGYGYRRVSVGSFESDDIQGVSEFDFSHPPGALGGGLGVFGGLGFTGQLGGAPGAPPVAPGAAPGAAPGPLPGSLNLPEHQPDALNALVGAVQRLHDQMVREQHVPEERIFLVGADDLFDDVRPLPDPLLPAAPADDSLVRKNRAALSRAVEKATGKKMKFLELSEEVRLLINGLAPKDDASAVVIDVGTGATRGGCKDASGLFVTTFRIPGAAAFEKTVGPDAGSDFAAGAAGAADQELRDPLKAALGQNPALLNRRRIYLSGGPARALAALLHPGERGALVALSAQDFKDYKDRVSLDPERFPEAPPPAGPDAQARDEAAAEVAAVREKYAPHRLIAGAQILAVLADELQFQDKEVYYVREGDAGCLPAYLGEAHDRDRGAAGK